MKNCTLFIIIFFLTNTLFTACNSAPANAKTEQIKVWGNCGMCEKTIEGALAVEGVLEANWDRKSDILTVVYDSLIMNNDKIQQAVADVGYDTENKFANDTVYSQLPKCCLYERKPKDE